MENIKIIKVESFEGIAEHVIIDRGNGEFTSMLKSTYDAQQAEAKASKVVDEAAPE
jgi:hypothetical protein